MFSYFTLNGYKGSVDGDPTDFNAYKGVPFGLESNDAVTSAAAGCCSVAASYCEAQATYGVITTSRTLLVEAEAAELGWISADAQSLYKAGIESWSDWRRYNLPVLPIYDGQALEGVEVYPYRMQYADADKLYNVENSTDAINKYLNGEDGRWQRVWWDTKDNK